MRLNFFRHKYAKWTELKACIQLWYGGSRQPFITQRKNLQEEKTNQCLRRNYRENLLSAVEMHIWPKSRNSNSNILPPQHCNSGKFLGIINEIRTAIEQIMKYYYQYNRKVVISVLPELLFYSPPTGINSQECPFGFR